jgi:hypothetical protein
MTDVKLGVTITGDASGLRSEVKITRDALRGLSTDAAGNAAASEQTRKATEAFSNALKQQTEGVVDLDKAQRELMQALDAAAAANQGGADAANQNKISHQGLFGEIVKGVGTVELVKRAWDTLKESYVAVRDATLEMQQSQARLEAVLNRTGAASGMTAASVNELVEGMARVGKFDDTALRNAATAVLSFGNVSQEALDKILKLSRDLAATGRGDLEQWATVLAKVGTSPAETLGLLERQLGKIDIATKVAIISAQQMGDVAKANALLFDLVGSRVGGVATESYRGLEKQLDGTAKAFQHLKEAAGTEIFSANTQEASIWEKALNKITEDVHLFADGLRTIGDAAKNVPDWVLVMMGLPTKAQFAQANAEAMKPGIDREIQALQNTIGAARASGGDTTDLERQLRAANSRKQQGLLSSAYAGAYDDQSSRASRQGQVLQGSPSAPASMFTPQGQLELQQQQLQGQQQLADQSYQILQEQIQRELALNDKKHTAGLMSEKEYYAQVADLQEQAESVEVQRLQEALGRQHDIVANARAQVGNAATNQTDPDALLAAQKAFDAEKIKERQIESSSLALSPRPAPPKGLIRRARRRARAPTARGEREPPDRGLKQVASAPDR